VTAESGPQPHGAVGACGSAGWGQRLDVSLSGTDDDQATFSCADLLVRESAITGSVIPLALRLRGRALYFLDRDEEALADLDHAIELAPDDKYALTYRGEARSWVGRRVEALADFNQAITIDPDYSHAPARRGRTYQAMGRYEEALADFTRAIELDPKDAGAIGSRGETYQAMERYDEALADLTRAIELNPTSDWAIGSRGETYRLMGRYEEALADLTRAIELSSDNDWHHYQRALALQCVGDTDRAAAEVRSAAALVTETLKSTDSDYHDAYNIGVYSATLLDYEGARNRFASAIRVFLNAQGRREAIDDLRELCTVPGMDTAAIALLIGLLQDGGGGETRLQPTTGGSLVRRCCQAQCSSLPAQNPLGIATPDAT
jgi:tetratricopeptide (TPR) repeat protein